MQREDMINLYYYLSSIMHTDTMQEDYQDELVHVLQSLSPTFAQHFSQNDGYHDWGLADMRLDCIHQQLQFELCSSVWQMKGMETNQCPMQQVVLTFHHVCHLTIDNRMEQALERYVSALDYDQICNMCFSQASESSSAHLSSHVRYRCHLILFNGMDIRFEFDSLIFSFQ